MSDIADKGYADPKRDQIDPAELRSFRRALGTLVADPELSTLTVRSLAVLLELADGTQPPTVRALAAQLGIQKPAITRAFDTLEERELLARAPDPSDRRSVFGVLTGTGKDLVRRLSRAQRLRP